MSLYKGVLFSGVSLRGVHILLFFSIEHTCSKNPIEHMQKAEDGHIINYTLSFCSSEAHCTICRCRDVFCIKHKNIPVCL